jgi:Galactosyltransferase
VDDDSYVRVALLMDALKQMPSAYAFMGYMEQPGGAPHRDPKNRWYVSPKEWPSDKYPPWAHGAGAAWTTHTVLIDAQTTWYAFCGAAASCLSVWGAQLSAQ